MEKYSKIRDFFNQNQDVYDKPIELKKLEDYLEIDRFPQTFYNDNSYWNKRDVGIGKILNELGIKAKLSKATIEFKKIENK